ncbi:DUF433 domain-containing protein [Candidatus Woesearchaeota archaeon]|nr:DUF433 domain-containing protein [Candidatus Woesearchaeota archaeon]
MAEEKIIVDPKICHGKPIIKGTRIMVVNILSLIAGGYNIEQVLNYYNELKKEDVLAAIKYAINTVQEEIILE